MLRQSLIKINFKINIGVKHIYLSSNVNKIKLFLKKKYNIEKNKLKETLDQNKEHKKKKKANIYLYIFLKKIQ